jgi:hypothetical protein
MTGRTGKAEWNRKCRMGQEEQDRKTGQGEVDRQNGTR